MTELALAYTQLVSPVDPARVWLDAGRADLRFAALTPSGTVVRGTDDLVELRAIIDDVYGPGVWPEPVEVVGEVRTATLAVARPASLMPFLEALRPSLDGRGPAFWTWKSPREAIANRLVAQRTLTVSAVLVGDTDRS